MTIYRPAFLVIFHTYSPRFTLFLNALPSPPRFSADALTQNSPRLIDDTKAKKLAADLKRCPYFETCAMYGLNVERVFQDGETLFHFHLDLLSRWVHFVFSLDVVFVYWEQREVGDR